MRRLATSALWSVALCGLLAVGSPAREARGAEDRPPVRIPKALAEKLRAVETSLRPEPRDPLPGFPGFRAATDYLDISTTGTAARLTELLVVAEKVRTALGWYVGPGKWPRLTILEMPVVLCRDAERRAWLMDLGLPKKDLEWELKLIWNFSGGLHVAASEPAEASNEPLAARKARGIAAATVAHDLVRAVYPKWPPFCREGLRFVVTAAVNGTTTVHITQQSDYNRTGRAYHAAALRDISTAEVGPVFNPHYLTGLIARQKDDDLRLALGKSYETLTADDDVKAFFFMRWLVEEVDPQGTEVRAWFQALADKAVDLDAATRPLVPDVKAGRVLEALDARFREHHARAHPLPPHLQRDWTGTWAPTPDSLDEWNKEARKKKKAEIRAVRLELVADGTWVESVEVEGAKEAETRGTWELDENGIQLKGKRFTAATRSELKFFRTRSLQEGDLVWQKRKGGD